MAKTKLFYSMLLSGTAISGLFGSWAFAADSKMSGQLPAVSALNGKVELGAGAVDVDVLGDDEFFYGGASLSVPLGHSFGAQADLTVVDTYGDTTVGGGGHLFMRDPASYLVGIIGGYSDLGASEASWGGAEVEFYLGDFSIEAAAGVIDVDETEGFGLLDLAFYPTENFRIAVGGASIAERESAHVAAEWMLDSLPLSIKGELSAGEDDLFVARAGLSFYFGGNEAGKSLMRRHREDDPRNRALEIFGSGPIAGPTAAPPPCIPYAGYTLPPADMYGYCTNFPPGT